MVKKQRNFIIEISRFLASLWVLIYHGYFITGVNGFSCGRISVDYFFILSGLYLFKSIQKYEDEPLFKGFWNLSKGRLKTMGVALPLGLLFSTLYFINHPTLDPSTNYIFGFLWYIPWMFIAFFAVLLIYKLVKKDIKKFLIILLSVGFICYLLYYLTPLIRIFSPFSGVFFGVAISFIPKLKWFDNHKTISSIISVLLLGLIVYLAYLPKETLLIEHILVFILFPIFLYLNSCFTVNCGVANFLGKISFGLYSMQCIVRYFNDYNLLTNDAVQFISIISLSILCWLIDLIIKKINIKKLLVNK